jgi:hypothetical protein
LTIDYETDPVHCGCLEAGTMISVYKRPVRVVGARFNIKRITFPDTSAFSLNIYQVKDDHPTTKTLYGPIKFWGKVKNGVIDVNLFSHDIQLNEDFFLALQWSDPKNPQRISFGGSLIRGKSFHRFDSSSEWEKVPLMTLGFSVVVLSDKDLPRTVNVSKLTFLSPGVSFELKTNRFQTLHTNFYAATSFGINFSSSQGTNTFLTFDPAATLQYRFYYNGEKRSERGKRTALNSMNYIAPSFDYVFTRKSISQEYLVPVDRRPLIQGGVVWGMQRNFPKRFSLDLSAGPGFYFVESRTKRADDIVEISTTGGFTIMANVRLGIWLNKR